MASSIGFMSLMMTSRDLHEGGRKIPPIQLKFDCQGGLDEFKQFIELTWGGSSLP